MTCGRLVNYQALKREFVACYLWKRLTHEVCVYMSTFGEIVSFAMQIEALPSILLNLSISQHRHFTPEDGDSTFL
jgi:hypothetical protein